jgi:hypothetical protein
VVAPVRQIVTSSEATGPVPRPHLNRGAARVEETGGTTDGPVRRSRWSAPCRRGRGEPAHAEDGAGTRGRSWEKLGMADASPGDDTKKGGENVWISQMAIDLA